MLMECYRAETTRNNSGPVCTHLSCPNERKKSGYSIIHQPIPISQIPAQWMPQIIELTNIGQNRYNTC